MIETIELMITLILLSLLYILLFGEPGYIIPTIELEHKVIETDTPINDDDESEVEYDDESEVEYDDNVNESENDTEDNS